jgi:hypothetical protein
LGRKEKWGKSNLKHIYYAKKEKKRKKKLKNYPEKKII